MPGWHEGESGIAFRGAGASGRTPPDSEGAGGSQQLLSTCTARRFLDSLLQSPNPAALRMKIISSFFSFYFT
jgi:hypothetical protein